MSVLRGLGCRNTGQVGGWPTLSVRYCRGRLARGWRHIVPQRCFPSVWRCRVSACPVPERLSPVEAPRTPRGVIAALALPSEMVLNNCFPGGTRLRVVKVTLASESYPHPRGNCA
jgi:hypothetical protein